MKRVLLFMVFAMCYVALLTQVLVINRDVIVIPAAKAFATITVHDINNASLVLDGIHTELSITKVGMP